MKLDFLRTTGIQKLPDFIIVHKEPIYDKKLTKPIYFLDIDPETGQIVDLYV